MRSAAASNVPCTTIDTSTALPPYVFNHCICSSGARGEHCNIDQLKQQYSTRFSGLWQQQCSRMQHCSGTLHCRQAAALTPSARTIRCFQHTKTSRRSGLQCHANKPVSPFQSSKSTKPAPQQATSQAAQTQSLQAGKAWQQGLTEHKWEWRGSKINYVTAGCGKPVLLVHGFGASCGHYRKTIPFLAQNGFKVYAIDLIGFGASDKPVLQYTIELWAELVVDFMAEFMPGTPAVLVGNSIGSLSCLTAAAAAPEGQLAGLVLLNSAGAMNNKGVVSDWRILLAWPLLMLIDFLLKTPPIARSLFDNLARPDTIRKVLGGVYVDETAVDDELVDIILAPAFTDNALDVFVSVITGPAGPKPWDLVPNIQCPLFVAWGDTDPFTPVDGPVGKFFLDLASSRPKTEFALLEGVGHCPQDDKPELLHKQLLPWLNKLWN